MKFKTLIMLMAIAVLFAALAYYSSRKKPFAIPAAISAKVLPNLAINRVGKLVITTRDSATTVAKSKEKWVVVSRFNYPANFDKVADMLRELSELKVGQTVNANPSQLGAFHLVAPVLDSARPAGEAAGEARTRPGASGTNRFADTGTLVELRDENDGLLASLIIGKVFVRPASAPATDMMMNFGGYPDGQYVRTFDGKVYLVSRSLERLTEPAKTWLADDFISVTAADIKEIAVSGPDRAPIKLILAEDGSSFKLADLRSEESALEIAKVNQITGALNRLGFDDLVDPALTLKETGLDRPLVFKATTKDGLIYNLHLGNTLTNDTFDRYFTISVTNAPVTARETAGNEKQPAQTQPEKTPEKKSAAEQAAELNGKFGAWIYVIKSYRAEPMLLTREDLIKKPEPAKTGGETADTPVIKAEEAGGKPRDNKADSPVKKGPEK